MTDEVNLGQGSENVKFNDNLAAIETLKKIEYEERRATPEEQRMLARYVGWGGGLAVIHEIVEMAFARFVAAQGAMNPSRAL